MPMNPPIQTASASTRWLVLFALLTSCATDPRVDDDTAELVVARGYIESGELYRWQQCWGPVDFLEVVNCVPGPRSTVRFRVEESIVGVADRKRLRARFGYGAGWPELKFGANAHYLAVFITDRKHYELRGVAAVSQTEDGSWAIPATFDEDIEFPCSSDEEQTEAMSFRSPRPRELILALQLSAREIDEADDEGLFTLEDGYLYANAGVGVTRAVEVYAGKSASQVDGCH